MKVPAALGRRLWKVRGTQGDGAAGTTAPARADRRTANLLARLRPGDIAIVDHVDIDRATAESLIERGASAVLNVAASTSGRYPNLGPQLILDAGVPLIDAVDPEIFARVREGEVLRLAGATLYRGGRVLATGVEKDAGSVLADLDEARSGLAAQLEAFAANTAELLRRERELLIEGVGVPDVATTVRGRHALVVVRGYGYREELAALRSYIREHRPVVIGVDGGADALLEAGHRPDIVVGDFDAMSNRAVASGAELVVHAHRAGRAPGLDRLTGLGHRPVVFPATGTSEDVAMLLADQAGASLIVAVGTHASLEEFLDKGRAGMASTVLTRLRIGGKLIDAEGVRRLHRGRISPWTLLALVAACLLTILVAAYSSPLRDAYAAAASTPWPICLTGRCT